MRRVPLVLAAASLFVASSTAAAQQTAGAGPTVSQLVIATGVENREPTGVGQQFPSDVGTLYAYMVVEGDFPEAQLTQVWMHGTDEIARVPLTVKGPRWRTWSSKTIRPDWTGAWTVKVVDADGNTLQSAAFSIGGGA